MGVDAADLAARGELEHEPLQVRGVGAQDVHEEVVATGEVQQYADFRQAADERVNQRQRMSTPRASSAPRSESP
jgi:hypothetical protein